MIIFHAAYNDETGIYRFSNLHERGSDMFPQTEDITLTKEIHVETVVALDNISRKKKSYVNIGLDAADYYKIKDSEKTEKK